MARPRKPSDPDTWPVPCGRCGGHYRLVAHWPDASVCGYCYKQAHRTRGTCACGHTGILPGIIEDKPACSSCSGIEVNIVCQRCGNEDELYTGAVCWRCVLKNRVDELLADPQTGKTAPQLRVMADALKNMERANSGLTWVNQPHVTAMLRQLATNPEITHETFDELPRSRTRDYIRALLVEHGALPARNETMARFQEWSATAVDAVEMADHRDLLNRYVHWHILKRMRSMSETTTGSFLRYKQSVTVAAKFLNWLTSVNRSMDDLSQADVDAWIAGGKTTNELVSRFLGWTRDIGVTSSEIVVPPHRRGTSRPLDVKEQRQHLAAVKRTDADLAPADLAMSILVLVFAQPVSRAVKLTWDDVVVREDEVSLKLGDFAIVLPEPLDAPWRKLADTAPGRTAAHAAGSRWVFPGQVPGAHVSATTVVNRLRKHFSARAARLGTLREITKTTPASIVADVLGYPASTIELHAKLASADYTRYINDWMS